jgi:hypothetical protein
LLHHKRQTSTFVACTVNRERLVAMFKAVAIRAMMNAPPIQLFDTCKSRDLIQEACSEQDFAGPQSKPIIACDFELSSGRNDFGYAASVGLDGGVSFEFTSTRI